MPSRTKHIKTAQHKQKQYHDKRTGKEHDKLKSGDQVRYLTHEQKWANGQVAQINNQTQRDYQIITIDN